MQRRILPKVAGVEVDPEAVGDELEEVVRLAESREEMIGAATRSACCLRPRGLAPLRRAFSLMRKELFLGGGGRYRARLLDRGVNVKSTTCNAPKMATRMPYWKQLLVSGSTAVSLSAAAAAALSAIMPEQRPSEALLSAASADIGAAAYVDTFSTRLGQRSAREKLAAHDGDGLARLFFECTAFAPEAFFLRHFGHRFAAHVEASPPWLFEPAAHF